MRLALISLGSSFIVGLCATTAFARVPVPTRSTMTLPPQISLATFSAKGKKAVKIRSIGFLEARLTERGFTVVDGRRHGALYFFRLTKDGYSVLITVDGRSADIVGLKILSAPAGATPKPRGSAGNHYIDWTYEYGYSVDVTTYNSYHSYITAEVSSTEVYAEVYLTKEEITTETSEVSSYEENMTEEETVAEDLDHGYSGDEAGNDEVADDPDSYPDETDQQAADEPEDGTEED